MESEIQYLEKSLKDALNKDDGWLVHFFGSQLAHIKELKYQEELQRKEMEYKLKKIKEESFLKFNPPYFHEKY